MKAAAFDYTRPRDLPGLLRQLSGSTDAKIIAGGQSLVPMMAMRLVRPALLVDINDVQDLQNITLEDDCVAIGACTRQADAEASEVIRQHLPLLAKALPFVGHDQTRNRGTVGGSLAHADPSAEIVLVAVTLQAELTLARADGERSAATDDFLDGPMTTTLEEDECLTAIRFPRWTEAGRVGVGFHEVSPRAGDFAVVAAAAQLLLDDDGVCRRAAVAVANTTPMPLRLAAVENALVGAAIDQNTARDAAALAGALIDPPSDLHASAAGRRHMARTLIERAILDAAGPAVAGGQTHG
ncbi:MAG: FAD binding domain-containing protein [Alphaproteobacteria bacterium]|nr:FAD binding domain-containing protein [Alphaproteobacteria bacterium]